MQSFAEFDALLMLLGDDVRVEVSTDKKSGQFEVWIHEWIQTKGFGYEARASAGSFLEALEMTLAAWNARRPKGVRGLLGPKRKGLSAVPKG